MKPKQGPVDEAGRFQSELMMTGALYAALTLAGEADVQVELITDEHNNATTALWVKVDFLRSRYRITVTMDPEKEET